MQINKQLSNSLMIANLVATILVIAIHYRFKVPTLSNIQINFNYLLQEFFTNGIAKIAVPFFAMISGFFLVEKLGGRDAYLKVLQNKVKTLLLPYVAASTIIFICLETLKTISKNQHHDSFDFLNIIYSIFIHPLSIQFWFLRDLILLVIISPLLIKARPIIVRTLLTISFVLWLIDIQIFPKIGGWYLISIDTFFFFCLGGFLRNHSFIDKILKLNHLTKLCIFAFWLILVSIRVWVDPLFDIWYASRFTYTSLILHKLSILIGIISLIQISALFEKNKTLIYLSGFTFFAYLFHLVPLSYFKIITKKILSTEYSFYLNFPTAIVLVFIIALLISKYFPASYSLITGGRSPNKAIGRTLE